MRRVIASVVLVVVMCSMASIAQVSQTPEEADALDQLITFLSPCVAVVSYGSIGTDFEIPAGDYCVYYKTYEDLFGYDFGYFELNPDRPCGPLIRFVEGKHGDCWYELGPESTHEPTLCPPNPALFVTIHEHVVQLWINGDWATGPIPSGFYTSKENLNWDDESHAYCYTAEFKVAEPKCRCSCAGLKIETDIHADPLERKGYLVFWDAASPVTNPDWDDFWVALIPAHE